MMTSFLRNLIMGAVLGLCFPGFLCANSSAPLSEIERFAVETALDFLSRGPAAIWDRLAPDAPLRRAGKAAAMDEIEVRSGPHLNAKWRLETVSEKDRNSTVVFDIEYPTGLDETLVLKISPKGPTRFIDSLRMAAENSPEVQPAIKSLPSESSPERVGGGGRRTPSFLAAPVLLGLLAVTIMLLIRKGRIPMPFGGVALASIVAVAAIYTKLATVKEEKLTSPVAASADAGYHPLGTLLPLRRAMALQGTGEETAGSARPGTRAARDVANLWKAQLFLQQARTVEARQILDRVSNPSRNLQAQTIKARLEFLLGRDVDAVIAYERALELGSERDGLLFEAAQSLWILGFEDRATRYLERASVMGTRKADVHYALASLHAIKNRLPDAERELLKAWQLRPALRTEIVKQPLLALVALRPTVWEVLKLSSPYEPLLTRSTSSTFPITLPPGARCWTSGDLLEIAIGKQTLTVEGGASIAPPETQIIGADALYERSEQELLDELGQTSVAARSEGALSGARARKQIEDTTELLVARNRWQEVADLTEAFSPAAPNAPSGILLQRASALRHLQKEDEATALLLQLARNPVVYKRRDVGAILTLAEALVTSGRHAEALRLFEAADQIRSTAYVDERMLQVRTDQRLSSAYQSLRSEHFEIRYPASEHPMNAQEIARVFESEFRRLRKWIPASSAQVIAVHILDWEEFRRTYSAGGFIIGLYDGKIRVPLAGIPAMVPEVVSLLSHELTHAMLSQATNQQAPHWFQEGLAQHTQTVRQHLTVASLYDQDKMLSLAVADAVLQGFSEPQLIQAAYLESASALQYIEARYGVRGIHQMIESFRKGRRTNEAIQEALSVSAADLDLAFRKWSETPDSSETSQTLNSAQPERLVVRPKAASKKFEVPSSLKRGAINKPRP